MSTPFTAPVSGDSKKLENVPLIEVGMQLCILYGICDIGTQDSKNFGPKHKVTLAFEFPQQKRVFYEGDGEKSSVIFNDETLSMAQKANLRKNYVQPMTGKTLTDEQAAQFDISSLLGGYYIATITHSADGKYANISSITKCDERSLGMFGISAFSQAPQSNDTFFFHLSQGFQSDNFKNLPKFLREKLKSSEEGRQHAAQGGTFAEPEPNQNNGGQGQAPAKRLVMNPSSQYTYEQLKGWGWNDDQIVQEGYASWQQPTPPPQPQTPPPAPGGQTPPPMPTQGQPAQAPPQAPPAQQPPAQPAPPQQQAPQQGGVPGFSQHNVQPPQQQAQTPPPAPAPAQQQGPKVVMKPEFASQPYEEWIKGGWNDQMLVDNGKADWVK